MIAELIHDQEYDLDDVFSAGKQNSPRLQRQTSSKAKWNTRSRYRRTKTGGSGAHRRRLHRGTM